MMPNYRYYDNTDGMISTAYEKPLRDYKIYGNSIQDGKPSPDNPIEIQSVGDYDAESGKYKISVEVTNENQQTTNYNIYLDEPLRKCGDYVDYIDFKSRKLVRNIYKTELINFAATSGTHYANGLCRMQNRVSSPQCNYNVAPMSNCMVGRTGTTQAYANYLTLNPQYQNYYAYFNATDVGLSSETAGTSCEEIGTAIKNYMIAKGIDIQYVLETPIETAIELPEIILFKGANIITVNTTTQPSQVNWQYYK